VVEASEARVVEDRESFAVTQPPVGKRREHNDMSATNTAPKRPDSDPATRNLASISPFFIVKDLHTSVSYYIERMGFQLDSQGPEGDPYYGRVSRDGIGIMLKAILPDVLPAPNRTRHEWARWDAYIYTLNPETLFNEFKERGVSFVKELSFIDQGLWGFEVTDADGYVLGLLSAP
jgi:Glyoxalase/Bleomycin resistance protein/Dioxygenase superfamily